MTVFDRLEAQLRDAHPDRARRTVPRPTGRHVLAFAAAAAAITAIAVAGLSGGSESPAPSRPAAQPVSGVPLVVPGRTTVAVLNAARKPGLARDAAVALQRRGWKIGPVANYFAPPLASSCVDFFPGHSLAATQIAEQLGISSVIPASDLLRKEAGQEAAVVVIVGTDRAR